MLDEQQVIVWQGSKGTWAWDVRDGGVYVCVLCYFRSFFPSCFPPFALCGSLIRQWAGLRPCLKGWSPGLLAEHLLKDHSTGYIWGGLLSSYWSLPPSLFLYFFWFAPPHTHTLSVSLPLYSKPASHRNLLSSAILSSSHLVCILSPLPPSLPIHLHA